MKGQTTDQLEKSAINNISYEGLMSRTYFNKEKILLHLKNKTDNPINT